MLMHEYGMPVCVCVCVKSAADTYSCQRVAVRRTEGIVRGAHTTARVVVPADRESVRLLQSMFI